MYLEFTQPIRRKVGPEDLLVYADECLVFRREGYGSGSIDSALHVAQIGLEGIENERALFPDEADWRSLFAGLISQIGGLRDADRPSART